MTSEQWEEKILGKKVAVSDTMKFISSSASISCCDTARGRIYAVYNASDKVYGQSTDYLVLVIIPICQPHKAENIVLVQDGVPIDGKTYSALLEENCIFLDGKVRVYFRSDDFQYYYVDFDPETKTCSKIAPVRCSFDGAEYELTSETYINYLTSRDAMEGYTGNVVNTCRMTYYEGYWYGCLTSRTCLPVVFRSKDAVNFELLGVIRQWMIFECQLAILEGKMYILLRGSKGDNFYVSDDLGRTFRACGRIEFGNTRPQLIPYRGKLLMAITVEGIEPNLVYDCRNNMKLLLGEGENLADYKEIFMLTDERGIVYYDITDYEGVLYMIWSNADLYLHKHIHAKDLLYYAKIGDLKEYIE